GPGHVRLPDHAALDVSHDIEWRAGDGGIVAIDERRGDREALGVERADHAELAVDRVRGGEQLARRLSPQNVAASGCLQKIGGIGLAALELPHGERGREIAQTRGEESPEPRRIDRQRAGNLSCAGKRSLAVDGRHDPTLTRQYTN